LLWIYSRRACYEQGHVHRNPPSTPECSERDTSGRMTRNIWASFMTPHLQICRPWSKRTLPSRAWKLRRVCHISRICHHPTFRLSATIRERHGSHCESDEFPGTVSSL
jgi:hypothetical protein